MSATDQEVILTIDDPVAVIRLNRPERLNAFTYATLARIREAFDTAAADPRVVGIVVTGEGRAFCAGLDADTLVGAAGAGSSGKGEDAGELPGLFTYLLAIDKPVIAAVNGVTAGGGFVLACLADVRFAARNASFTTVFGKRGLIAEHGMTWIVPRLVGSGFALDLLFSSRRLSAEEAQRIGLVQYVVEPEELLPAAIDYVKELAANVSPGAMRDTKQLVYRHMGVDYPAALREADDYQWRALDRPDAVEGMQSFVERRPPRFERLGSPDGSNG